MEYRETLSKVAWPLVYFIACIFVYASVLRLPSGGISTFLTTLVSPISEVLSPFAMVAVFLMLVALLTNFISNAVTGAIGVTVCVPILSANPVTAPWAIGFSVLVAILCNYGLMTPGGSGNVAIAEEGGFVTASDMFKYSLVLVILVWLISLLFWPLTLAIF